jgi:TPP-dependent pyruvate/acetoin dehydrogenase alpha subunit
MNDLFQELFRQALRIRLVEETVADLYPSDRIQSPVHLSIGQEHIPVSVCRALEPSDCVLGSYRGHALYLAKGGNLNAFFAELFGKQTGCGKGKAGSMHLSAPEVGMMGSSAIVASVLPHAAGIALAAKIRKTDQVVACFFGEGATCEGIYHETLNFARLRRLPLLFVCENNGLAIHTRSRDILSFSVVEHATSYGIKATGIPDGMDMIRVFEETRTAVETLRSGNGPVLLEIATFRFRQHVGPAEDFDLGYRKRSELAPWLERDPLVKRHDLRAMFEPDIREEIDAAIAFAEGSPFPDATQLMADVY